MNLSVADRNFIHPELQSFVPQALELADGFAATVAPFFSSPPGSASEMLSSLRQDSAWLGPPGSNITWNKRVIAGPNGNPALEIYIINEKPGAFRGGILHMHGGGFVVGTAYDGIVELQKIAATLDCTIVTVNYRLAPEATYLDSTEDNYAALIWTYRNAAEIGINPEKIALLGESAGGGHAALLAIIARDRGEVPIAFQCLSCPMLDDRTGSTAFLPSHIGRLLHNSESNRFGWKAFLGRDPGDPDLTEGVPGREPDLRGLPPTWIGVGSADLFVAENISYARRLIEAAVRTELVVVPGAFHGFELFAPETDVAKEYLRSRTNSLRKSIIDVP